MLHKYEAAAHSRRRIATFVASDRFKSDALIVAYVSVLKYMAEKPEELLELDTNEQAATPAGASTSPVLPAGSAAWT